MFGLFNILKLRHEVHRRWIAHWLRDLRMFQRHLLQAILLSLIQQCLSLGLWSLGLHGVACIVYLFTTTLAISQSLSPHFRPRGIWLALNGWWPLKSWSPSFGSIGNYHWYRGTLQLVWHPDLCCLKKANTFPLWCHEKLARSMKWLIVMNRNLSAFFS